MEIIDVFTYNGEREILDLRLNILSDKVDRFIIVEAKTTFSGNKKPLYFSEHERFFQKFWPQIDYFIVDENYSDEEHALAETSPNTRGAAHWKTEFLQKESIKKALKYLNDDDLVFIGDVDEIWNYPQLFKEDYAGFPDRMVLKLKLRVYAYYLNNRSNEEFWGPILTKYKNVKDQCLNHLRSTNHHKSLKYHGWHFTSMGGVKEVSRKLNDSYTPESYNTLEVQQLLPERVKNGTDYLGRPFEFTIDESEWPLYLKENKVKYSRLCISPQ